MENNVLSSYLDDERMNYQVRTFAFCKLFESAANGGKVINHKFFKNLDRSHSSIEDSNENSEPLQADVYTGGLGISYSEFVNRAIQAITNETGVDNFFPVWNGISPKSIKRLFDAGWEPITVYTESRIGDEYKFTLIIRDCTKKDDVYKPMTCTIKNKNLALIQTSLFENEIYHFVNQSDNNHN